ncbi:MAG: hypothetical protein HUU15_08625 [Candidatus Brocadiae bacterium]|nr:hypothetical protein [Candidatus Brocadiia bacterium]
MRYLLPAIIVLSAVFNAGCTSAGSIRAALGIKPAGKEFGPFREPRDIIWEAAREVIADEGYRFPEVSKEKGKDWEFETDWTSYGSDWRYENHRYRITLTLSGPEGSTIMEIVAEKQSNSGSDPIDARADAWEDKGQDDELADQYAWSIRKKFSNGGDIYDKLMKRYEEEGKEPTKPPDYSNPETGKR